MGSRRLGTSDNEWGSSVKIYDQIVIIEDTLSMFKEFISSQTVRKNYYLPNNNLESDWLVFGIEDPIMGR